MATAQTAHVRSAAPSLALVLPALVFVAANVLKFQLGVDGPYDTLELVLDPRPPLAWVLVQALVLAGPVIALALSAFAIVRASATRRDGTVEMRATLRLHPGHLVAGVLSLALLASMALYLVAENL